MHAALSYDRDSQDQAQRLLDWITQLGEVPPLIVCRENDADSLGLPEGAVEILYIDHVRHYPESKNLAFQGVAGYMNDVVRQPYLYLEPDCVPTRATWWQEISEEYAKSRKAFLGPLVPAVRNEKTHMAAIAVYPHDLVKFGAGPALNAHEEVFVTAIAGNVVRQMFATKLIAHDWQGTLRPNDFALYHPDRDGSILESLSGGVEVETQDGTVQSSPRNEPPEDKRGSNAPSAQVSIEPAAGPTRDHIERVLPVTGDPKARGVPKGGTPASEITYRDEEGVERYRENLGDTITEHVNGKEPWADKLETEQAIVSLVRELRRYGTRPAYVRYIRKVLKSEKVTK